MVSLRRAVRRPWVGLHFVDLHVQNSHCARCFRKAVFQTNLDGQKRRPLDSFHRDAWSAEQPLEFPLRFLRFESFDRAFCVRFVERLNGLQALFFGFCTIQKMTKNIYERNKSKQCNEQEAFHNFVARTYWIRMVAKLL